MRAIIYNNKFNSEEISKLKEKFDLVSLGIVENKDFFYNDCIIFFEDNNSSLSYDFLQNIIKNHNFVVIIAYDFNEKNIIKYYEMGINLCINFEENFIQIYNKIIEKVLKYEDMPILKYKQLIIYKDFSFYYNDTQVFFSELEKKILFLFIKRHDCIISKEELLLYLKYFERESFDKYIGSITNFVG